VLRHLLEVIACCSQGCHEAVMQMHQLGAPVKHQFAACRLTTRGGLPVHAELILVELMGYPSMQN
jgi:hypothetical protein